MALADGSSLPTPSIAQSLPPYIIYEILNHFSAPLILSRIAEYPWYLAHICSSWRVEFFTMRRNFWNEVILHYSTGLKKKLQPIIDVLTMFLECNRGHPFELYVRPCFSRKWSPYFLSIFGLLISESPRWRRASLEIGTDDIPGLYCVKDKFEHLESLQLSCRNIFYTVPDTFTDLFMTAPCLTRLSLKGLSTWNFKWSIMTFMHIGWDKRNEMARLPSILSQAVRLETLIIYLGDKTLPSMTSIILPSLLSLVTDSISLIQVITTPSLKKLDANCNRMPELVPTLKSFFDRSRCHLRALRLTNLNAPWVIEILSYAPDIRTLCLVYIHNFVDVFGWLNGTDRVETPKLTCLQSLGVYRCIPPERDHMHKILDFVARRGRQVGSVVEKLQKFGIHWEWGHGPVGGACEALEEQLTETCKLYNIQCSSKWDEGAGREDVHGRSQHESLRFDLL